jgi:L-iditol 2-dehydrogenase
VPLPTLEPGAMLVRIDVSTLCGTDVHRWRGELDASDEPYVTGHEPCGFVEEIAGPRLDLLGEPLQAGDRVVWSYPSCGSCYWCAVALQPCLCPRRASWGHSPVERHPHLLGSCAEYMYVPPACQVVRVPDAVPSPLAAAAACALRTVMHAFERLGALRSHETVLVQGSGAVGIFAVAVARESGAKRVLVIGGPAGRLGVAARMGADALLDLEQVPRAEERLAWVREQTSGRGADVVVQAATASAVAEGLQMMRPGGRYASIGGGRVCLELASLPPEMTFFTVRSGEPRHWLQAVEFLETRRCSYPFDQMVGATYPLERVNDAMEAMASFEVVKAAVDPKS